MFPPYWNRSIDLKCKSVSWVFYSFIMIFSIWVLFPTNLDNSQDNTGKEVVMWFWDESKLSSLYLVISHEHWRFTGQQGKGGDNRYAVLNLDAWTIFWIAVHVIIRLLLDEICHVMELAFDWAIKPGTFSFIDQSYLQSF